jgi:hypoxanthine phosphoribosyltransferase
LTEPAASGRAASVGSTPSFAHASEAELARILDFYEVRWAYEPDTFPIGWNLDGDVVESFSPDFYLPDLDLYVELTTLKQKLVRKKNRKLRRLRELYPDVHIKLFYARDFRMLLLKFGRLALSDELTGTTGQATPPRVAVDDAADDPTIAVILAARDADAESATIGSSAPAARSPETAPVAAAALPSGGAAPAVRGRRRGRRRRRPAG